MYVPFFSPLHAKMSWKQESRNHLPSSSYEWILYVQVIPRETSFNRAKQKVKTSGSFIAG